MKRYLLAAEKGKKLMKRLIKLALTGLGICTIPFLLSACGRGWKNVALPNSFSNEHFVKVEGDRGARGKTPVWGWTTVIVVQNNTPYAAHPAFQSGKNVRYYSRRTVPSGGKAVLRVGPNDTLFCWVRQDSTPAGSAPVVVDRLHLF